MSGTAALVVATVAVVSLLALALVVLALVRRTKDLTRRLSDVQRRLGPSLAQISHETRVAEQQLRQLGSRRDRGRP